MTLGDLLVKVANGETLSYSEKEEMRRHGNLLQQAESVIALAGFIDPVTGVVNNLVTGKAILTSNEGIKIIYGENPRSGDAILFYRDGLRNAQGEIYGYEWDTNEYALGIDVGFDNGTLAPDGARLTSQVVSKSAAASLGCRYSLLFLNSYAASTTPVFEIGEQEVDTYSPKIKAYRSGVRLNTESTAASVSEEGMFWQDSASSALKYYGGGGWRTLSSW